MTVVRRRDPSKMGGYLVTVVRRRDPSKMGGYLVTYVDNVARRDPLKAGRVLATYTLKNCKRSLHKMRLPQIYVRRRKIKVWHSFT